MNVVRLVASALFVYVGMVGVFAAWHALTNRPTTEWALAVGGDDGDPLGAKVVRYVQTREECVGTQRQGLRCVRVDHYRHENRVSIQFVDK